jgi:hypothetical protein
MIDHVIELYMDEAYLIMSQYLLIIEQVSSLPAIHNGMHSLIDMLSGFEGIGLLLH